MEGKETINYIYNELVSLDMKTTPKYKKALSSYVDLREELDKLLNEEEKKKLDTLEELRHEMGSEDDSNNFVEGFCLGAKLIIEIMGT